MKYALTVFGMLYVVLVVVKQMLLLNAQTQVNNITKLLYSCDHVCVLVALKTTTNAKYVSGDGKIVYSNLNSQDWQKSFK